jgi:hypothetical protein
MTLPVEEARGKAPAWAFHIIIGIWWFGGMEKSEREEDFSERFTLPGRREVRVLCKII